MRWQCGKRWNKIWRLFLIFGYFYQEKEHLKQRAKKIISTSKMITFVLMFKAIKYTFVYLAAFIVLLHNLVPHVHQSQLSEQEHQLIHENETSDFVDVLALIFHEFTDEGEMEEIVLRQQDNPNFVCLKELTPPVSFGFELFDSNLPMVTITTTFFVPEKHPICSGIQSAWGIRPPPFA